MKVAYNFRSNPIRFPVRNRWRTEVTSRSVNYRLTFFGSAFRHGPMFRGKTRAESEAKAKAWADRNRETLHDEWRRYTPPLRPSAQRNT